VIEDQEKNIILIDTEASEKLASMQHQLEEAMKDNQEMSQNIFKLENMVQCLTVEADQNDEEKNSDKALIDRLSGLVEKCGCEQDALERMNDEIQDRVDSLRGLLEDKEAELRSVEISRDQREGELLDELDRVRSQLNDITGNQRKVLDNKEEEIHLLKLQMCKYEDIIDEAEYVTHEQRCALMENKREIQDLSLAIERVQNSGLLSQLDKMWCGSSDVGYAHTLVPPRSDGY
jgi:chromosome segregation ATPase